MCDQVHNGVILIEILLVDPTFVPSVDRSPLPARSDRRWCDCIPVQYEERDGIDREKLSDNVEKLQELITLR